MPTLKELARASLPLQLVPQRGNAIMNDTSGFGAGQLEEPQSAFAFEGVWREFLPIALTNLLLTIVTLGIYRFWAQARERRYLWSRTRFIDDVFEWTGTGKEMFIGFLIVFLVIIPIFVGASFAAQALLLRQEFAAAAIIFTILYAGTFYLIGVAQFRALRYRLSRSWWHGIRGGSDDGGWHYGWQSIWKTVVGWMAGGLLVPWSMTSLWNDRWNKMSFGQHQFEAHAEIGNLIVRWLAIFLVPFAGMLLMGIGMAAWFAASGGEPPSDAGAMMTGVGIVIGVLAFYLAFLVATVSYYAAFYRQVAAATSIAGIEFEFTARTRDWMKLILGNIGLVIVTLGVGLLFLTYRNWSFAVRHLEASGNVDLDALFQSPTRATTDAEGLADAFDIGAI
jgi:uncharacterized membrane protein YjgN (DUF898 family)